ncbi:methionyl-tRNA formyltransferase [Gleimia hominis]|uniref:methionyl-tRNA formyltransferase n=1 Tax=Gleimia hominis TaxID=595468 RepID=UPI000C7FFD15|nr:methionyl-tRNA formyltransferase [Gleimia hominis]WIK65083.1 methionyl-tRNA formyltransferase [Gleimia hominis]
MKVLFAGTPEAAVPTLRALHESSHEVVGVLTRPSARRGRGRTLHPSPVAVFAREHELPLIEANSVKSEPVQREIQEAGAQLGVVVAYGAIIPQTLLDALEHGWINAHFSKLPRWRGAAPVQRAIEAGDTHTAVDVFELEASLDTGDIYRSEPVAISNDVTGQDLLAHMSEVAAPLVTDVVDAIAAGTAQPTGQPNSGATYAHMVDTKQLALDFTATAQQVHNKVRAWAPTPGTYTTLPDGARMKVLSTRIPGGATLRPGELQVSKHAVLVGTGSGDLELLTVAPAGKKPMRAADWARGARLGEHAILGVNQ